MGHRTRAVVGMALVIGGLMGGWGKVDSRAYADVPAGHCAITGDRVCDAPTDADMALVPLHCWGEVIPDGTGRVIFYELPVRDRSRLCTDDGVYTTEELAAMRARAESHHAE